MFICDVDRHKMDEINGQIPTAVFKLPEGLALRLKQRNHPREGKASGHISNFAVIQTLMPSPHQQQHLQTQKINVGTTISDISFPLHKAFLSNLIKIL
ncbi:2-Oxoisovalerate Dehydrogenase Subunit Beta [Manis pentadactyla]|nr:2-Oxoisovalerate Dehydrogenase Subunit Beta [Manis pentadactyla]